MERRKFLQFAASASFGACAAPLTRPLGEAGVGADVGLGADAVVRSDAAVGADTALGVDSAFGADSALGADAAVSDGALHRWPAWRARMSRPDTLYYVSAAGPSVTRNALRTPLPSHFGDLSNPGRDVISGYSSGVLIEQLNGPCGSMVYGTGGHTRIQNQILGLDLNTEEAEFFWWQQPTYQTSDIEGAEIYYNPEQFAAMPPSRRIPSDESVVQWDGGFPVGFDGWIFPRKLTTGQLGRGTPHGLRYSTVCHVPVAITGAEAVYFASFGPQGPFAQSWLPSGVANPRFLMPEAMFGAENIRRLPYYFKSVSTGSWREFRWQPEFDIYGFVKQSCGVFSDLRRIYVSADRVNGTAGWWYLDMTRGIEGLVRSDWFSPATSVPINRYSIGAWTDGHRDGRHLAFFLDASNQQGLVMQDFDRNDQRRLDIRQGLNIPGSERTGLSYDAVRNRIYVVLQADDGSIYYYIINVPSDPYNVAGYTVARHDVTLSDPAMAMQLMDTAHFYGKTQYHSLLRTILIPVNNGRMLGFVPA